MKAPKIFIQWKGTDVCLDFHCKCGALGHVDDEFVYALKCDACGTIYRTPDWLSLEEASETDDHWAIQDPTIVETRNV